MTPGLDGFKTLAYFDGFIIIGLGSLPAGVMSFNVAWILINAANGTCCKISRIKQAREA